MANRELEKTVKWLNANKLKINITKSKWILISLETENRTNHYEIKMGSQLIARVTEIKYLEFEIDEKFNFDAQINMITKKLASKENVLYRISDKITFDKKSCV